MKEDPARVVYFGEANFRERYKRFGIKAKDRLRHMYVIGKTGMGKSTMLENLAVQDIQNGSGLCFLDPHGATADKLLDYIPEDRIDDVIYFAPFDLEHPISFNVLEDVGKDARHLVVAGLMSTFKKIWVDAWSARMEYILNNTLLALLEYPGATLLGVNRMYTDKAFRNDVVNHITDPGVKAFWVEEYAKYTDRFAAEATPAIQNKVGQFTSNPLIRNIIGQPTSSFDFRKALDSRKIIIVNLSKGLVGEGNAALLGSMLITKVYLAAMSRANLSEAEIAKVPPFYLHADEFQSFANESFADILSEARKYKLGLVMAHQYIEQMPEEVRDAVFGNVGTTIAFRVGPLDAEVLEKLFTPNFTLEDCVNLGFAEIYLSLMIDGVGSPPFSARTLPPIPPPDTSYRERIIKHSRETFAMPREKVEEIIANWHGEGVQGPGGVNSSGAKPSSSNGSSQPSSSGAKKKKKKKSSEGSSKSEVPKEAAAALGSNDLKSLLADAMKEADQKDESKPKEEKSKALKKEKQDKQESKKEKKPEKREERKESEKKVAVGQDPQTDFRHGPKEVPEAELKALLRGERDGD